MATIEDVSPNQSNMPDRKYLQFTTGRMLSVDSSDDGRLVFAGAFASDVWISEDGGGSWSQIGVDQPDAGQFGIPGAIGGHCVTSIAVAPDLARWSVDRDPRVLADVTGEGRVDIVGFGETGVWTALSRGDGTFAPPRLVINDFGYQAGGWRVEKHPRVLAVLTNSGRADLVGFGDGGVWTALSNGDGTFQAPRLVLFDFGYDAGGWRVERHPRFVVDVTGDGHADIVGFGDAGVYVALGNGDGTFRPPRRVLDDFGYVAGGWRVDKHPRFLADVTGTNGADIVGFGDAGVYVALSNGDGTFTFTPVPKIHDFGYVAGGWRVEKHPRLVGDVTGNGHADIVGFGEAGVYVALSKGDGTFAFTPVPKIHDFGYQAGGWRIEKHPRFLADVTGTGGRDIVGFGDAGVYVATGNSDGTFAFAPVPVVRDFGYEAGGWRVDKHPRVLANITGIGGEDVVGFGDAGVYVSLAEGGPLGAPRFVLPNLGFEATVIAMVQADREAQDAGVWRTSDRGRTWSRVHTFPRSASGLLPGAGQVVWAPGTANLVYAAGATSLAVSTDGGATFTNVMPGRFGGFQRVTHVAVAETPAGEFQPPAVYALAEGQVSVSFDAGMTWIQDTGAVPSNIGGGVATFNAQNDRVMVVSPRSPLEVFVTGNANLIQPELWRGDYSNFVTTHASLWTALPVPNLDQQFSGNVFMAATRPGHGEVIFYCPQRRNAYAASLDPTSADDWHKLDHDNRVHQDLHGIFLAPDFHASFQDGSYAPTAGTIWMASDGGIFRSTDGGDNFDIAGSISTLSVVNIAGVALPGQGPVISLNTGDNDGFATGDGGRSWRPMRYGGGDNDCSWADPLHPTSMLVFTPRWDTSGNVAVGGTGNTLALYEAGFGTPSDGPRLPDVSTLQDQRVIPGPPLRAGSTLWNAVSGFAIRGYRPIVANLPGDDPTQPGDYIFIRFFGNFNQSGQPSLPNNLAVLLRTRNLGAITARTDWDTPGGWRVDKHPRLLADLTASGRGDVVGFGDAGVWTALSNGDGTFATPRLVVGDFGYEAGGWRVERHPRFMVALTNTGRADFVGFGDAGVWTALSNGDGTFATPRLVVGDFGYEAGGWRVERHPRFMVALNNTGRADFVGFGDAGVWTALSNDDGTFQTPRRVIGDFGYEAGGWRVERHPRMMADLTGDNGADFVGFGDAGVWTALSNGDGTFQPPRLVLLDFGYEAGGWRVEKHPRFVIDVTGDGHADIVGFGDAGVYVALGNGDGTFQAPNLVIGDLGYEAGGWRVEKHPRLLANLNGTAGTDIVAFGDAGVYVALSNGDGTFAFTPIPVLNDFGYVAGGWRVDNHIRFAANVTNDGRADIVGFGDAGVLVSVNNGDATFRQRPLFVIPNFGYGSGGPVVQQGPFLPDPNVGIVQASGGHINTVFYVGGDNAKRLWKWTDGMPAWQQLAPGGGATNARRFFVNPYDPNVVYLLSGEHIMRSDNGGVDWQLDTNLDQMLSCSARIPGTRDEDDDAVGDHYDIILTDMQFDPHQPGRRFALGLAGAFMTNDGVTWIRLLDTAAMRGRPANCYFDWISQPADPALYVSFAGRSIVKISGFAVSSDPPPVIFGRRAEPAVAAVNPPVDRPAAVDPPKVRTSDGRVGTMLAAPDGRVLVTLDSGQTLLVDTDQVRLEDGRFVT